MTYQPDAECEALAGYVVDVEPYPHFVDRQRRECVADDPDQRFRREPLFAPG